MGIRSDLDSNFDVEIVDEFLDHYSMMVECMDTMILDLSKESMYTQSINELFRIFHNINSASGFLKITQMSKLASFVEESIEHIRTSKKSVNKETINWLLSISSMFSLWKNDLKLDNKLSRIKYSLLKLPDLDLN